VPFVVPVTVGENVTPITQLPPAAMLVPQVLLATAKPALVVIPLKFSATLWLFVSVTVFAELVFPTGVLLKLRDVAERVTGVLPVPLRLTVCGLFSALSVNISVPVAAPIDAGEKVTPTTQLAPAAILVPQVLLAIAKPVVAAIPEKFKEVLP